MVEKHRKKPRTLLNCQQQMPLDLASRNNTCSTACSIWRQTSQFQRSKKLHKFFQTVFPFRIVMNGPAVLVCSGVKSPWQVCGSDPVFVIMTPNPNFSRYAIALRFWSPQAINVCYSGGVVTGYFDMCIGGIFAKTLYREPGC